MSFRLSRPLASVRPTTRRQFLGGGGAALVLAALAACGGSATATVAPAIPTTPPSLAPSAAPSTTAPSAAPSAAPPTAPSAAPTTGAAATARATVTAATTVQKVNANTATVAELTAAFTAAGIGNAARWAREVEEYRPYPTNDPTFAKLRGELAKYNPGPGVVDQIIATLSL